MFNVYGEILDDHLKLWITMDFPCYPKRSSWIPMYSILLIPWNRDNTIGLAVCRWDSTEVVNVR